VQGTLLKKDGLPPVRVISNPAKKISCQFAVFSQQGKTSLQLSVDGSQKKQLPNTNYEL